MKTKTNPYNGFFTQADAYEYAIKNYTRFYINESDDDGMFYIVYF